MRDWTGELANQVLGQLKNQLRRQGVSFETRTPTPLSAQALAMALPKTPTTRPVLFRAGTGALSFWCDLNHAAEFELKVVAAVKALIGPSRHGSRADPLGSSRATRPPGRVP